MNSWYPVLEKPARQAPILPANVHLVTVVSKELVTPLMLRVKFACANVAPFIGGEMHVRLLLPQRGRYPVWPEAGENGSLKWPKGEDEILLRAYTIRAVDEARGELWIDFLQHTACGVATPGADFARDVGVGEQVALLGPGSGHLPQSHSIIFVGDETALPAIARIAAEVPAGTRMSGVIEVFDETEEQPLPTRGLLNVQWLHRRKYQAGEKRGLINAARKLVAAADNTTFIWVACEKDDVRELRATLKKREHRPEDMYVAWYWSR